MCSETNAQGEITFIRLILKTPLFWDFFRPSPCQFRQTFRSGLSITEWRRQTRFWWLFGLPTSSSWCSPGTTRRQSALTSFSIAEISLLGRYQANRAGSRPFLRFRHLLEVLYWCSGVYFGMVFLQKPVLGWRSWPFRHKNREGLGWSLLEAPYIICFPAGLSKLLRQQKAGRRLSFSSFSTLLLFNRFAGGI